LDCSVGVITSPSIRFVSGSGKATSRVFGRADLVDRSVQRKTDSPYIFAGVDGIWAIFFDLRTLAAKLDWIS